MILKHAVTYAMHCGTVGVSCLGQSDARSMLSIDGLPAHLNVPKKPHLKDAKSVAQFTILHSDCFILYIKKHTRFRHLVHKRCMITAVLTANTKF